MQQIVQNVGFQFSKSTKQWMVAFLFASVSGAAAMADDVKKHYELLSLEQVEQREQAALNAGRMAEYYEYDTAGDALRDTAEGNRATPYDLPTDFEDALFAAGTDGLLFKVVDPRGDFDWTEYAVAQKTARVHAEKVPAGTVVETIMADGHVETSKTAGPDGGYRVTNPSGEQYLVDTEKFERIYDLTDEAGVYAPKPDPRKVLPLEQNVAFEAPWGEKMYIKSGGVLVNGGGKDVYGIQSD